MAQPVVTRSQRRIERKLVGWIVVLVLAVAGVSFALGYVLGQRGDRLPGLSKGVEAPRLPIATQPVPPPPEKAADAATQPEKLTFYDNLPKGDQAPLGSGINLPPKTGEKPDPKPASSSVKSKPAEVKAIKKAAPAVPVSSSGAYIVQIASFRTTTDAQKLVSRLQALDLPASVERADLGAKGVWYRVVAGPYDDRGAADQVASKLKEKERLSALVRKR